MENINYNINGGFPPIKILDDNNKKDKVLNIKKERGFSNSNVNILNIISSKKEEIIKKKVEEINVIDSL